MNRRLTYLASDGSLWHGDVSLVSYRPENDWEAYHENFDGPGDDRHVFASARVELPEAIERKIAEDAPLLPCWRITVYDQGDPSVGICRAELSIEWPCDLDSREEQEAARAMALRWYAEIGCGIGRVRAVFDGECELCCEIGSHSTKCPDAV